MSVPFIDLDQLHAPIREELSDAFDDVSSSGQFIKGPHVAAFEGQIAEYLGCEHAIGVSSGSDALLASLMALDIGEGDEVVTTPFTFCATGEAILRVGATPVFVDIDPQTFNIDPDRIEDAVTDATRAILPVHLFGQCARMDQIMDVAERHDLYVVEDAAQAIGARHRGRHAGTMGHLGCFSFFPTKNLGAFGDGGLVTTDDPDLAGDVRLVCNHGNRPKYTQQRLGGNFRLDAIQAAILGVKLPHLDEWNAARRANASYYQAALQDVSALELPASGEDSEHVFHIYSVRTQDRARLSESLRSRGVGFGVYYPRPLHRQPLYESMPSSGSLTESEDAAEAVLALPVSPSLTDEQRDQVVEAVLAGTVA